MRREYSAGVVVYYKEKGMLQFLLLQYERQGSPSNFWDFPKGHVEENETKQETALRELKEETGLKGAIQPDFEEEFTYFLRDPRTHVLIKKTVNFFLAETFDNNVVLSSEHIGYVWLPYTQALQKLTFENARDLLKKAQEFLKTEEK